MPEDEPLPPVYDPSGADQLTRLGNGAYSELPAYTSGAGGRPVPATALNSLTSSASDVSEPKAFTYDLALKGKGSGASLTVHSDSALSKHCPTFVEGSKVSGVVKLSSEGGEAIQSVVIAIRGQILAGANASDIYTFLDISQILWESSAGDPSSPGQKWNGKLQGDYEWLFSIELPKEVALPTGSKDSSRLEMYRLPHSFMLRHARATVRYELIARFARKVLRTDHRIFATIGYIPITRPDPPSTLRQLAYQENSVLLGPVADPEGWFTLEPVQVHGKLCNERSVNVKCTLSLAKPLCYTRGTVIPVFLSLRSSDLEALELFSSPRSVVVRLRRCIRYHKATELLSSEDEYEHFELATWWRYTEGAAEKENFQRDLSGEIHLQADLKPTTAMMRLHIEYSVVLFHFDVVTFEPKDKEPLAIQPVEIATAFAPGPHPRVYTPPEYHTTEPSSNGSSYSGNAFTSAVF